MPTYEYACRACGHQWEVEQSMKDKAFTRCAKCGEETAERMITGGAGFILKGGGWFSDLYGSSKGGKKENGAVKSDAATTDSKSSESKSSDAKAGDSKSSESKSDSKSSESKSDSKSSESKSSESKSSESTGTTAKPGSSSTPKSD